MPTLLTIKQAAQRLGLPPRRISDAFYEGRLSDDLCYLIGGSRTIPETALDKIGRVLKRSGRGSTDAAYQDAINSDSFLGFSAGKVKVAGISATSQTENKVFFWAVTYEFHFRREGWQVETLDQGRNCLILENLVPIFQRAAHDGQPIYNMPVARRSKKRSPASSWRNC